MSLRLRSMEARIRVRISSFFAWSCGSALVERAHLAEHRCVRSRAAWSLLPERVGDRVRLIGAIGEDDPHRWRCDAHRRCFHAELVHRPPQRRAMAGSSERSLSRLYSIGSRASARAPGRIAIAVSASTKQHHDQCGALLGGVPSARGTGRAYAPVRGVSGPPRASARRTARAAAPA